MPISDSQTNELYRAGTVQIPADVSQLGLVLKQTDKVAPTDTVPLEQLPEDASPVEVLVITERHEKWSVRRLVPLSSITAIHIPTDASQIDLSGDYWLYGPEITSQKVAEYAGLQRNAPSDEEAGVRGNMDRGYRREGHEPPYRPFLMPLRNHQHLNGRRVFR